MYQLFTPWANSVTPENVWREYPRPQMVRDSFFPLNGIWKYAITSSRRCPKKFDGDILVPFSPESALSGVNRQLHPSEYLWYFRTFSILPEPDKHLLLHFGAVDQFCIIFVNRHLAGSHKGGYLPFHIDITPFLKKGKNELYVMVQDLSDSSYHSRGKQKLKSSGMFYTAQSGIWQSVWMEYVPRNYIQSVRILPNFDENAVTFRITTEQKSHVELIVNPAICEGRDIDKGAPLFSFHGDTNTDIHITLSSPNVWTPEEPFLYPVEIRTETDSIRSYFALRKCDLQTDSHGITRLFLNNRPYPQIGILDQGYWPDGLYTPPSDEALIFDIRSAKKLGFNMIRKHVKVECDRFYYHCDRLGLLVWQDMINGGSSYHHWFTTYLGTAFNLLHLKVTDNHPLLFSRRHPAGQREYYEELEGMINALFNHPCIVCWIPFNEGWGQFNARHAVQRIRHLDPTRLIDHASGWFDQGDGDIRSIHYYYFSLDFHPEKEKRALALTEFGGYSHRIPSHSYTARIYGYQTHQTRSSLTAAYQKLIRSTILPAMQDGISATIYTQLSDVEEEMNGLFTYDRAILKFSPTLLRQLNRELKAAATSAHQP